MHTDLTILFRTSLREFPYVQGAVEHPVLSVFEMFPSGTYHAKYKWRYAHGQLKAQAKFEEFLDLRNNPCLQFYNRFQQEKDLTVNVSFVRSHGC